jgi:ribokinase
MTPPRVVVAGNLSLDDTINPGGTVPLAPGGDALYAALGVAAWGLTPTLLTLVGEDYPAEFRAGIDASGIDTSKIRAVPGPTVHYQVTNFDDGTREYRWISPETRLAATSPEAADYAALEGAAWLHIAAMPMEAQEVAVQAARDAGVAFSLDPHEEYVRGFEPRLEAMVEGAAFLPSELEARLLFPDLESLGPVDFAFTAAQRLDAWRPFLVAIKLGSLGAVVRWGGRNVHVPAPFVNVIDTTGAGDAWCGGFVAGWLATRDARVGAVCGTIAAGEIIGRVGALAPGHGTTVADRVVHAGQLLDALPVAAGADLRVDEVIERLRGISDPAAGPAATGAPVETEAAGERR